MGGKGFGRLGGGEVSAELGSGVRWERDDVGGGGSWGMECGGWMRG